MITVYVNHKDLNILSRQLQAEAKVTVQWFSDNALEANPDKFQGLLKEDKEASDFREMIHGQEIEFSKSITALGIFIDENLTSDEHWIIFVSKQADKLVLANDLGACLTCRVGRLFTIVSLFQILSIVHLFGIYQPGKYK